MQATTKNPTSDLYEAIQMLYDHFNVTLYESKLPPVLFTTQRQHGMFGYFAADRWTDNQGEKCHEIAINPQYVAKSTLIELMQTLAHEMCHCWQHCYGKPSIKSYHNKQWSNKMKSIGLMPSSTGAPGGAFTGQNMMEYPLPKGKFINECQKIMQEKNFKMPWLDVTASGFMCESDDVKMETIQEALADLDGDIINQLTSNLSSLFNTTIEDVVKPKPSQINKRKHKYSCPDCEINVWGKADLNILCGDCGNHLVQMQA